MIPDQISLMLPFLKLTRDKEVHLQDAVTRLSFEFSLSYEELNTRYPNGNLKFENNVSFAKTHLKQAGLIFYPKRGYSKATEIGKEVLNSGTTKIDRKFLEQFKGWREFRDRKGTRVQKNKHKRTTSEELETIPELYKATEVSVVDQLDEIKFRLESKISELANVEILLGNDTALGIPASHPMYRLANISNNLVKEAYQESKSDQKLAVSRMSRNCTDIMELVDALAKDRDQYVQKNRSFQDNVKTRKGNVFQFQKQFGKVSGELSALENILCSAYTAIHENFAEELIKRVRQLDELEFATEINKLIQAMGYKEPEQHYIEPIQRGDEDSLRIGYRIKQDALGVAEIYVQAVNAPASHRHGVYEIWEFDQLIKSIKATSGIIISTAGFESNADEEAKKLSTRIELISGVELAQLMIEYGVGCREKEVFKLMEFDPPINRFG